MPAKIDTDALIRWTSKIAHEQGTKLVQMETELSKLDSKHLGQVRVSLQMQGRYSSIKIVLISLLEKFPGLTLEHFVSKPQTPTVAQVGPPVASDESVVNVTVGMVYYSKAPQAVQ